jgi:hypothetical protein
LEQLEREAIENLRKRSISGAEYFNANEEIVQAKKQLSTGN